MAPSGVFAARSTCPCSPRQRLFHTPLWLETQPAGITSLACPTATRGLGSGIPGRMGNSERRHWQRASPQQQLQRRFPLSFPIPCHSCKAGILLPSRRHRARCAGGAVTFAHEGTENGNRARPAGPCSGHAAAASEASGDTAVPRERCDPRARARRGAGDALAGNTAGELWDMAGAVPASPGPGDTPAGTGTQS